MRTPSGELDMSVLSQTVAAVDERDQRGKRGNRDDGKEQIGHGLPSSAVVRSPWLVCGSARGWPEARHRA
jgi:hypothetical protein